MKSINFYRNILTSLVIIIIGVCAQSQTILIDPTTDGGFENGASIATNNWTVVNSSTNTWRASGVSIPYQGSRAAFISANSGVDYVYNTGAFQTSHFYRDVTVPVGENLITLNFYYKNPGEFMFDRLLVYTAPTSIVPVAMEPLSDVTTLVGATLVYTDIAQVNDYIQVNIQLPQALAGTTFRLIFTWQNDNIDGSGIPASIDNIGLTSQVSPYGQPLNGNYTINNLLPTSGAVPIPGSNFNNFNDAITYLNSFGKSGDVRFDVSAGQTFNHGPLTVSVGGSITDTIGFIKFGNGPNPKINFNGGTGAADGGFTLSGVDYITVNGIDMSTEQIPSSSTLNIESVIKVVNASATNGSQYNVFKNCVLTQNQLFSQNIAILQSASTAPTTVDGTNSYNTYENLTIDNALNGIRINSNSTNRDQNVIIKSCNLGSAGPGSIGNAASAAYGINVVNAAAINILSNTVSNLSSPGGTANALDGIVVSGVNGLNTISGNTISAIRNTTNSICVVSGIRCVVAANGSANIFNNFISDLTTSYTTLDATIRLKGMSIQPLTAVGSTSVYNIDFNSVSLNPLGSLNVSNACIEVIQPGPIVNIRNNIFANYTGAQSGLPFHYGMVVPNLTIAAAGSLSNYNDIYIDQASNGIAVRKSVATAANYNTLALWTAASALDAQSISADPVFVNNNSDLHSLAAALDGVASMTGITWIQTDIDGQSRSTTPDIGADEFTLINLDIALVEFISPIFNDCFTSNEQVTVRIRNLALPPHDFYLNPVQFNLTVGGANPTSISITVSDNNLNANQPLGSLAYLEIPIGAIDMSVFGAYNFTCDLVMVGDEDPTNNSISGLNLLNAIPISYPEQVAFDNFNGSNLNTVYPNWNESTIIGQVTGTSQWIASSGLGSPSNVTASYNFNSGNNPALIVGPKLIPAFNTFISFEYALTEAFSNFGTGAFDADDEFTFLVSTDCGFNFQPVLTFSQGDLNTGQLTMVEILLDNFEGQEIIPAFYVNDGITNGTGYRLHLDNINIFNSTQEKIKLMSIEAPMQTSCFSSDEEITVRIKNTGYIDIDFSVSPLTIAAVLDGPLVQTSNLLVQSGILQIGSELNFTLTNPFDLTQYGSYVMNINADLTTTSGLYSDSIKSYLFSQNPAIVFDYADTACFNSEVPIQIASSVNGITNTNLPTFSYSSLPVAIPDGNSIGVDIPITVSGSAGFAGQLVSIEIDSVLHGNVTHLSFELIAPNGSSILLTNNNIGAGPGFYSTTFSMNSILPLSSVGAPFTGEFLPNESFYALDGTANGVWYLRVKDLFSGEAGVLYRWSLILKEANYTNSYLWSSQNTLLVSDENSASFNLVSNSPFVYEMVDAMGCAASDSVEIVFPIFDDQASVIINPVCFGENTGSISVVITGAFGDIDYSWQNVGLNDNTANVTDLSSDTYNVIATDAYGCSESFEYILTAPQELMATSSGTNITCSGCTATITVTASGGVAPYSGTGEFEVSADGTYSYTVTDANGCTDTTIVNILETTALSELGDLGILIYPNPFENKFVVALENKDINQLNINLIDQYGREVYFTTQAEQNSVTIHTVQLETGIYYLKLTDSKNGDVFIHKLVKSNK